jgi:hypothetical protein
MTGGDEIVGVCPIPTTGQKKKIGGFDGTQIAADLQFCLTNLYIQTRSFSKQKMTIEGLPGRDRPKMACFCISAGKMF